MISLSLLTCVFHIPVFFVYCLAEIEAKEACDWLRAAGFPQYAQLYEGNSITITHTQTIGSAGDSHAASRSCFLVPSIFFFSIILLSSPPPGHCFLFPGSSSHPERWVMGKALLSLLGLLQPSSLHSSIPPFPFPVMSLSLPLALPCCYFVSVTCSVCTSVLLPLIAPHPIFPPLPIRRFHNCRVSCI